MTEPRFDEDLCCVCRRPTIGLGVTAKGRRNSPIGWVCDDQDCIQIARNSFEMKQDEFGRIDELATQAGGDKAGEYLDSLGKPQVIEAFSQLTELEWQTFCRELVGGYRTALKTTLRDEAPF